MVDRTDTIELTVAAEALLKDLTHLGVLSSDGEHIRFRYSYYFCFFVAYYLNQSVHRSDTRAQITELCQRLHHRISSDIVLFLAHLTGDPIVLDEMIKTCDRLFDDAPSAVLEHDVEEINRLSTHVNELLLPDTAPEDNRRRARLQSDERVHERLVATMSSEFIEAPDAENEATRRLFDTNAAFKTIQILGQALRNVAGSTDRSRKEEVIQKLISLSKRLLGTFLSGFEKENLPVWVDQLRDSIREQNPEIRDSELIDQVTKHLFGLANCITFLIVKHTSVSVGAENLAPTLHRMLNAGQATIDRTIGLSVELDRPGRLRKDDAVKLYRDLHKNPFAQSLIRMLVAHHIYMFVVPYNDRQSICDLMSIKLLPVAMDPKRKKLQ